MQFTEYKRGVLGLNDENGDKYGFLPETKETCITDDDGIVLSAKMNETKSHMEDNSIHFTTEERNQLKDVTEKFNKHIEEMSNVDNTSDKDKPVSTAQQEAIDFALKNSKDYTDEKVSSCLAEAKAHTDKEILDLIDGAPEKLDTFREVYEMFESHENVTDALNDAILTKANQSDFEAHVNNKVIHITQQERETWNAKVSQDELQEIVNDIKDGDIVVSKATKLETPRNIQTNLASTSPAPFDGTKDVALGVTGILGVSNGGTGKSTVQEAFSALSKITNNGNWTTAPTGISAWKYEQANVDTYNLPTTNCFILVIKESNNRGTALGLGWASGDFKMWRNTLHDDTGNNKWKGWVNPTTWENISNKPSSFTSDGHTHDDRYYTETETNNLLASKQANLGFTPVQQGGGTGQGANKVYIGWSGSRLKAQVDSTDIGNFVFDSYLVDATVKSATNADTVDNHHIVTTTIDPGEGSAVSYADGTIIFVYEP